MEQESSDLRETEDTSKVRINDDCIMNEFQYFQLLFSNEIVELLVEESNNYMRQMCIEKHGPDYRKHLLTNKIFSTFPYLYVTKGISKEDILAFIGMRIYMGIHHYDNLRKYWNNNELYNNIIQKIMPKNYFFMLSGALHFPEKEKKSKKDKGESSEKDEGSESEENIKVDPRHKIKLYLEKLSENFQKYYILGKNITIDESITHFNGRNTMKFYIPMKPHKWGFKIHLLCDSDTHYLYNMLFDPGKIGKDFIKLEDNESIAESVVLRLISCIHDNKQRNIFFDGWYSSISLMKKLTKMGYLNTTILRNNSKELPVKILKEGYDKAYCGKILVQKYEGKKTILFATNYEIDKEELRNIYNIKNRGVDTFDQYLEISSIQRRTKKWYKKILLFGIDAAIINAKIIFELNTGKSYTTIEFKEKIVEHIFKMYKDYNTKYYRTNLSENNFMLALRHELNMRAGIHLHNIKKVPKNKKPCKKCQKETNFICIECNIHIHPDCFLEYHNKHIYNKKQ